MSDEQPGMAARAGAVTVLRRLIAVAFDLVLPASWRVFPLRYSLAIPEYSGLLIKRRNCLTVTTASGFFLA